MLPSSPHAKDLQSSVSTLWKVWNSVMYSFVPTTSKVNRNEGHLILVFEHCPLKVDAAIALADLGEVFVPF